MAIHRCPHCDLVLTEEEVREGCICQRRPASPPPAEPAPFDPALLAEDLAPPPVPRRRGGARRGVLALGVVALAAVGLLVYLRWPERAVEEDPGEQVVAPAKKPQGEEKQPPAPVVKKGEGEKAKNPPVPPVVKRPRQERAIVALAGRRGQKGKRLGEGGKPGDDRPGIVKVPPGVALPPGKLIPLPVPLPPRVARPLGRVVAMNDLRNVRIFMDAESLVSGRMPAPEEVEEALRKEAPRLHALVANKSIVLTGARSREDIWAYTTDPGGGHLVVTSSGIERMSAEMLRERLGRQGR